MVEHDSVQRSFSPTRAWVKGSAFTNGIHDGCKEFENHKWLLVLGLCSVSSSPLLSRVVITTLALTLERIPITAPLITLTSAELSQNNCDSPIFICQALCGFLTRWEITFFFLTIISVCQFKSLTDIYIILFQGTKVWTKIYQNYVLHLLTVITQWIWIISTYILDFVKLLIIHSV